MQIDVLHGPPGCGKSERIKEDMLKSSTLHLFVTSRVDLINERIRDFEKAAAQLTVPPKIVSVHGQNCKPKTVTGAITDAVQKLSSEPHAILAITHEGLMLADPSQFKGWSIHIDELPPAVSSGSHILPTSYTVLDNMFDLKGSKDGWSEIVLKPNAANGSSVIKDQLTEALSDLYARVRGAHGVYVNVTDWSELKDNKGALQWLSIWTPRLLSGAARVQIAAAGFFDSLLYKACQALGGIQFIGQPIIRPRTGQPKITIHYFTKGHRGSTQFWEKEPKRECLNAVVRHLIKVQPGYWSGNEVVRDYFRGWLKGDEIRPKAEGTNTLTHHESCAYIYSSKSTKDDAILLEVFGWGLGDIERAREYEDILQFVGRGAIRDPGFDGDYDIYLYDEWQAQWLHNHLATQGMTVELVPEDGVGIMDIKREKTANIGPTGTPLTAHEKAKAKKAKDRERKQKARQAEKDAKIAAGTYRGPGRAKPSGPSSPASQQPSGGDDDDDYPAISRYTLALDIPV